MKANPCCSDMVFVLDLSGGCPGEGNECNNWKLTKSFLKEMIADVSIGLSECHVGLVFKSVLWTLDKYGKLLKIYSILI